MWSMNESFPKLRRCTVLLLSRAGCDLKTWTICIWAHCLKSEFMFSVVVAVFRYLFVMRYGLMFSGLRINLKMINSVYGQRRYGYNLPVLLYMMPAILLYSWIRDKKQGEHLEKADTGYALLR